MARGSVCRKDNGWSYRVDLGPTTGKRRQLAKHGLRTRKEAETAVGALLTSISRWSVVVRATTTTEEFLRDWLARPQHRLRATTLYSYEKAIERVTRTLGKVPLQPLTPLQIEKFYSGLLRDGARLGKPLSAKTVRKALADAERLGLVFRNAGASARPPTAARREFATWSSDDLRDFCAGIRDERIFPALLVLATTTSWRRPSRA